MLNHGYLAQRLRRPLPTKDGGTLRTMGDAANYIIALPEESASDPLGPRCSTPLGFGGRIRESAASSNSPCFMIGSSISKCRHAETSTYARDHHTEIANH
jgi:hypothetical protein